MKVAVEAKMPIIMFRRSNSADKYQGDQDSKREEFDLINLLQNCEVAARPITFETIDLVQ